MIGFWKKGKQNGVFKYMRQNKSRYGLWKNGVRQKWFKDEKEFLDVYNSYHYQEHYENFFYLDIEEIKEYFNDE